MGYSGLHWGVALIDWCTYKDEKKKDLRPGGMGGAGGQSKSQTLKKLLLGGP